MFWLPNCWSGALMLRACLTSLIPSLIVLSPFYAVLSHSVVCNSAFPWTVGPQGSSVHGICQARILEGVAISFSRGSSRLRDGTHIFCIGRRVQHWQMCPALADGFFTTSATCEAYSKFLLVNHNVFTVSQPECIALKDGEMCLPGN